MSATGHLTRKNKWIRPSTERSSLKFAGPGPHAGLQPPQYLLEGQHNRTFLKYIDDNFLFQETEEPARRDAVLDLILINHKGLIGDVKVKGRLGCGDHEMVEFRLLRAGRRVQNKFTTLHFKRADFGLFKDLLRSVL